MYNTKRLHIIFSSSKKGQSCEWKLVYMIMNVSPSTWQRRFAEGPSSRFVSRLVTFSAVLISLILEEKRIRTQKRPENRHKQSDQVLVKKFVLTFFVVLGKEDGQQTRNRFDIHNRSSQKPKKNKSGSPTKSFDGLFAKTWHPLQMTRESSFGHFQYADRLGKTSEHPRRHQNIHENSLS